MKSFRIGVLAAMMMTPACMAKHASKNVIKPATISHGEIVTSSEANPLPHPMIAIMAVADFKNLSPNRSWNYMEAALPDLISVNLLKYPEFKVIERKRLQDVLQELHLPSTGIVDPVSAQRIGKILGANIMVLGSITQLGEQVVIILRLVKVETAELIGGVTEYGKSVQEIRMLSENATIKIAEAIASAK